MSTQFNKKTRVLIIGSALVAILVLYFAVFYPWPTTNSDLSGTVGGVEKANKYQAEQISDKDVAVQEGIVQKLIQNDKIQKLINDPNFQKIAGNDALKETFENALKNAVESSLKDASQLKDAS